MTKELVIRRQSHNLIISGKFRWECGDSDLFICKDKDSVHAI